MNRHLTEEEVDRLVAGADERGRAAAETEPRAVKAWYDAERRLVMFEMRNGCVFGFPQREGMGIEDASPGQLAEVDPGFWGGEALRWDSLNADISVPGIMFDLLNVRGWYAKWLGSAKTEAKAAAARANGKKGGRPREKAQAAKRTGRRGRATSGE